MEKFKENPKFSNKKIKISNKMSGDESSIIKKFLIIILIILLIILIFYFLTDMRSNDTNNINNNVIEGTINYEKVTVGTIFNRPYEEYYVIAYNSESDNSTLYSLILNQYTSNSNLDSYLKIYYCDLNNKLNSKYVSSDNSGNKNADSLENLSFGEITLLKIKNKKIVSYIEGYDDVKKTLTIKK